MATSKKDLDALIAKAGVGKRTAKKLHEANGTTDAPTPARTTTGGHGASTSEMPNFGAV